jgi:MFS family permease
VLAGIGIGAAETAHTPAVAALAPEELRGSAFGLLATVQAGGNVLASVIAGLLYTIAAPTTAFSYVAAWMFIALIGLAFTGQRRGQPPVG